MHSFKQLSFRQFFSFYPQKWAGSAPVTSRSTKQQVPKKNPHQNQYDEGGLCQWD
jgi:hypothetical protein